MIYTAVTLVLGDHKAGAQRTVVSASLCLLFCSDLHWVEWCHPFWRRPYDSELIQMVIFARNAISHTYVHIKNIESTCLPSCGPVKLTDKVNFLRGKIRDSHVITSPNICQSYLLLWLCLMGFHCTGISHYSNKPTCLCLWVNSCLLSIHKSLRIKPFFFC